MIPQDNSFRNVTEIELDHGINAGIRLRSIGKGMVPLFEEHEIRIENKMSLEDWDKIPYMERAIIIAVSRTKRAITNLQSEAEIRDSDTKAAKGGRR